MMLCPMLNDLLIKENCLTSSNIESNSFTFGVYWKLQWLALQILFYILIILNTYCRAKECIKIGENNNLSITLILGVLHDLHMDEVI